MGQRGAAVATTFADRWGVPVQASSEKGVALLDEAVESLAERAGLDLVQALVAANTVAANIVATNTPEPSR
jgi:hypothetical protein